MFFLIKLEDLPKTIMHHFDNDDHESLAAAHEHISNFNDYLKHHNAGRIISQLNDEIIVEFNDENKINEVLKYFHLPKPISSGNSLSEIKDEIANGKHNNDKINDYLKAHFESSSLSPEQSNEPEEITQDHDPKEAMKIHVRNVLQQFQQNKDNIEQLQQTDPEEYNHIINMLKAMIEMARMLGLSPEANELQQDEQQLEQGQEQEDPSQAQGWEESQEASPSAQSMGGEGSLEQGKQVRAN